MYFAFNGILTWLKITILKLFYSFVIIIIYNYTWNILLIEIKKYYAYR